MTRRLKIEDLPALAVPSQPALSPDGHRVAYVVRTLDVAADRTVDRVWVVDTDGGTPRRLTAGPSDTTPVWSPDGTRLAFVRGGQVAVVGADGGEPEQVTDLTLGAGEPRWSPDGHRLAFAAAVDPSEGRTGPIVSDGLDYQGDGRGLYGAVRAQLHVVDLDTGAVTRLTDEPHDCGTPAWSPDGSALAFTRQAGADADLRHRTPVHLIAVDRPFPRARTVGLADGVATTVEWTADGSAMLVVGWAGDPMRHARLLRVDVADGAVTDLVASLDRNVMAGAPAYPGGRPHDTGDRVLFCLRERGCTHVWSVGADGAAEPLLAGPGLVVSGLSVAADRAAVALATPTSFGEIALVDLADGTRRTLTDHGAALADVELFPRQERSFEIADGTTVQGWLVHDPEQTGPRPLLLDIHGGPHNAWNDAADEMHLYHQELVGQGWAVLLLNPRGSDGYGEAFYDGVRGAWGVADAPDFLEPLDRLVAEGLADPDRLAVAGYSYGGFMTCWLTAHDDRFESAVAGGTVSDLVSIGGSSDDAALLNAYELDGAPWADPERYAAMSPLTRVADVRTPTLLLHGAEDRTCPLGQAQQWHTALRERGVPTRLVVYPGGSHLFPLVGPPSQRMDFNRRVVEWLQTHTTRGGQAPLEVTRWERRLATLAQRHHVPGAQLGILRLQPGGADEVAEAAYGVLNRQTGAPVRTGSLFQIGSITKVWTATLAMALVDEGVLDLDTPVAEVLPELRLADPAVTRAVTLRHLLTHTSGIDGDVFTDTGRGDDSLEKYVAQLGEAGQNHPVGATWSYCNSGYSLLGRVIERVTGLSWEAAVAQRLVAPLGLARTVTLPEEAIMFDAAVGHEDHDGEQRPALAWALPRSVAPAGLVTCPAADVLAFARMHLTGGLAPDDTRVLSADSAAAMAARHADLPDPYVLGDSWGLGWIRFDWGGHRLIGHDGTTLGQAAFLRILPEQGLAVVLLTNGGHGRDLYEDLFREVFQEVAGVEMPRPFAPPEAPAAADIAPYAGAYERASVRIEVEDGADGPLLRTIATGPLAELIPDPVEEHVLVPVADALFAIRPPDADTWMPVTFYELPTGEAYLHMGARATPRVTT